QRQDAEHRLGRGGAPGTCGHHSLAQRVQGAGADVTIDDPNAAQRERGKTCRVASVAMPIGRRRFRGRNCNIRGHGILRPLKAPQHPSQGEAAYNPAPVAKTSLNLGARHAKTHIFKPRVFSTLDFWGCALSRIAFQIVTWVPTSTTRPVGIWK